ncbi:MAG: hypothetical protein HY841_12585 [Bacteroidetes bacterium]|nr:hypothetical protein [Bacteroidota bacterium]
MKTQGRIPRVISAFVAYLNNTADYLFEESPKNWERLNLLEADAKKWSEYRGQANTLYTKYTNKKETRTTAIKDKLRDVQKKFNTFGQPILDHIATWRGSTIDDFEVFRIKAGALRDTEPSPAPAITDPMIGLINLGGGDLDVKCRLNKDQTRPSVPHKGVMVQVQYALTAANDPAPPFIQCVTQFLSTHAHFILHLGVAEVGKRFYGYFRWYDSAHPANSGPWTPVQTIIVA